MKKFLLLTALLMPALLNSAHAEVTVIDAWAEPTAPGQTTGAVYLTLKSDTAVKLVGVQSSAAAQTQLHEMKMGGGMMMMRELKSIDLPAGETVDFKNAGYHVMLANLIKPIVAGDKLPLTLTIEDVVGKRSTLKLQVEAHKPNNADIKHDDGMGGMKM